MGNENFATTAPPTTTESHFSSESSQETKQSGLPPSIAPNDYGQSESTSQSLLIRRTYIMYCENIKFLILEKPIDITKNYHVIDRDSFLIGAKHYSTSHSLTTDSSPGQVPPTHSSLIGNDENSEDESQQQGGYGLLQAPPHHQQLTYGARPILRGEVGDKYVPKMPSGNFNTHITNKPGY